MSGLSLDSMPPLSIPLRFFLSAPWFGVLASLLVMVEPDAILNGRWSIEMLAFTHLITLGFMMMIMTGALFQFIPVITGHSIPGTRKISPIIHITLITGTLVLVAGFLHTQAIFFQFAVIFLLIAVGLFAVALTRLLLSNIVGKEAIFVLRLVNIALFITLGLGIYMAIAYALPHLGINMRLYTDLHMVWGLLGWTILLVIAVSSQVIPMFHVTPVFPANYLKFLSVSIVIILIFGSWDYLSQTNSILANVFEILLSLAVIFFALFTLRMISKRKRKVKDMTIRFWKLALVMPLLAVCIYWLNGILLMIPNNKYELLLGLLIVFGFTISSILGMSQKIVSFITYIHLQRLSMKYPMGMEYLPNMQILITVKSQEIQFYIHITALVTMASAIFFPFLAILAGGILLLDFAWLNYSLIKCTLIYKEARKKITEAK